MHDLSDLISNDNIIKIRPTETMAGALSKLSTTHDAAFVFSQDDVFLGVINPYYSLIQSSHPGNAKVERCLYHPPKLLITDSVERASQLFMNSRIHYLPVFKDDNQFLGMLSANKLLAAPINSSVFKIKIGEIIKRKNKPLITVYENDQISTAINLFKKHKISKLVVIGKDLKMKGIFSYYDLIHYLITPKERLHQKDGEVNKISFYHQPVKHFSKTAVLTMKPSDSMVDALDLVMERKIGSIVIVNEENYPLHIITKRDFLTLVLKPKLPKPTQITSKNLSQKNKQVVKPFLNELPFFLTKLPGIIKAKVFVKEEKNGGVLRMVLSLIPQKGKAQVVSHEGKNSKEMIKDIVKKIVRHKKGNQT
ncbi:MAG: CBS domain-containing protein [Candidatus Roizmanbacteria bacterium]|nr:MAG: CBS domain-containing protein [Candidatus Roizmanbacteria bacterium]